MATFTNQSKNSSSFSNQSKNTASWSGLNKTLTHSHLLAENGNYLTQENGDHILLELSSPLAITWTNQTKN